MSTVIKNNALWMMLILIVLVCCTTPEQVQAQTVYTTRTGTKYHRENCRYLSQSKFSKSLADAIKEGYEPCKVCKPPTKVTAQPEKQVTTPAVPAPKAAEKPNTTATQCTAKTKSGTRCERMTTNKNGKCWQHQ